MFRIILVLCLTMMLTSTLARAAEPPQASPQTIAQACWQSFTEQAAKLIDANAQLIALQVNLKTMQDELTKLKEAKPDAGHP